MLEYLIIINIVSLCIYGIDKLLAIKKKKRISEFVLLYFGFIGGPLGSYLGMLIFRHKIKKIKFKIFIFIYLVLWGAIIMKLFKLNSLQ